MLNFLPKNIFHTHCDAFVYGIGTLGTTEDPVFRILCTKILHEYVEHQRLPMDHSKHDLQSYRNSKICSDTTDTSRLLNCAQYLNAPTVGYTQQTKNRSSSNSNMFQTRLKTYFYLEILAESHGIKRIFSQPIHGVYQASLGSNGQQHFIGLLLMMVPRNMCYLLQML